MLIVKEKLINAIPVIEIVPKDFTNSSAPLAFFYHGWTSSKDAALTYGTEIAKRGFRVIIADAINHGRRFNRQVKQDKLLFFKTLRQNVVEFPQLLNYYDEQQLIKDDYISVSGVSMGGMTTALLLRRYEFIKSSVILMGTAQQTKFNQGAVNATLSDGQLIGDYLSLPELAELDKLVEFFNDHDLSLAIEKINQRPILFWHAVPDEVVPAKLTVEFVDAVKHRQVGENVHLKLDKEGMHRVPFIEMARMGEFLKLAYENKLANIMQESSRTITQLYGVV